MRFWILERTAAHLLCSQVLIHTSQLLASYINHRSTMEALCLLIKAMYVELLDNAPGSLLTLEKVEKETNNAGWPNTPEGPQCCGKNCNTSKTEGRKARCQDVP